MPPRRKPRTLRERMQYANLKQPLEAKRRGGLSRWAQMTDEQRAAHIEKLKVGAAAHRERMNPSVERDYSD